MKDALTQLLDPCCCDCCEEETPQEYGLLVPKPQRRHPGFTPDTPFVPPRNPVSRLPFPLEDLNAFVRPSVSAFGPQGDVELYDLFNTAQRVPPGNFTPVSPGVQIAGESSNLDAWRDNLALTTPANHVFSLLTVIPLGDEVLLGGVFLPKSTEFPNGERALRNDSGWFPQRYWLLGLPHGEVKSAFDLTPTGPAGEDAYADTTDAFFLFITDSATLVTRYWRIDRLGVTGGTFNGAPRVIAPGPNGTLTVVTQDSRDAGTRTVNVVQSFSGTGELSSGPDLPFTNSAHETLDVRAGDSFTENGLLYNGRRLNKGGVYDAFSLTDLSPQGTLSELSVWFEHDGRRRGIIPHPSGTTARPAYSEIALPTPRRAPFTLSVSKVRKEGRYLKLGVNGALFSTDTLTWGNQNLFVVGQHASHAWVYPPYVAPGELPIRVGDTLSVTPSAVTSPGAVALLNAQRLKPARRAREYTTQTRTELHPVSVSVTGGTLSGAVPRLAQAFDLDKLDLNALSWTVPEGEFDLQLTFNLPTLPLTTRAMGIITLNAKLPDGAELGWLTEFGPVPLYLPGGWEQQGVYPLDSWRIRRSADIPSTFTLRATVPPQKTLKVKLAQVSLILGTLTPLQESP